MWTEINFVLGKNGIHTPSRLVGRSIVVVKQAGRQVGGQAGRQTKCLHFKIYNFNSKACLGCLNEFMVPIAFYQ